MTRRVIGGLAWGQALLFGGLLVCIALRPEGLGANDGISYYGIHRQTILPFAVTLLGSAILMRRALLLAAPATPSPDRLRASANWLTVFSLGIVLTPFSLSGLFDWVHTIIGGGLFVLQLLLALQLFRWTRDDVMNGCLLGLQFTGALIAAVFVLPKDGFLIQGQIVFQFAFGALLIRALSLLLPAAIGAPSPNAEAGQAN